MECLDYKNNVMHMDGVNLKELASKYGTPLYVYSKKYLEDRFDQFNSAITDKELLVCYAVKANSNIAILQLMAKKGAGFDIVSCGELSRVIKAGGDPKKVVYSGVAKSEQDIKFALDKGILCFNVESEAELLRINEVACSLSKQASISIRVNPDVDAKTHPYISTGLKNNKFGVQIEKAFELYKKAAQLSGLKVVGIDCHIGSQLTTITPFMDALDRVLALVDRLKAENIVLEHIDIGGGLGVVYKDETPPTPMEYLSKVQEKLTNYDLKIICEPGRAMVANAGILLAKCEYIKKGEVCNFCIVDTAMNDLIRPSLYESWMDIKEVEITDKEESTYNIVGPICETGDFLGKDRILKVGSGDYLVVKGAGAYGFAMSSNYNSRPRAAEILVDQDVEHVIRERETFEDLWQKEKLL